MPYLIIKDRDKTVFEGEAEDISGYNKVGQFTILADHANFISLIENKLIIKQMGATKEFPVSNGLIKAKENRVWVYLGIK